MPFVIQATQLLDERANSDEGGSEELEGALGLLHSSIETLTASENIYSVNPKGGHMEDLVQLIPYFGNAYPSSDYIDSSDTLQGSGEADPLPFQRNEMQMVGFATHELIGQ